MMNNPLVSIIIPTYNRAHLIGETLDSILAQTYENLECIIVDDGSTDTTFEVVGEYLKKDTRFQYHQRPNERPKGANACRNYGFELSKGEYINWFDSDDIMMPNKIEVQIRILSNKYDFSISNFQNFGTNITFNNNNIRNVGRELNTKNFIFQTVFWITNDFIGKKNIFSHQKFAEDLSSGQEYHFFIGVLLKEPKGIYCNEILTLHRIHDKSIQQIQNQSESLKFMNRQRVFSKIYFDYIDYLTDDLKSYIIKNVLKFNVYQSILLKSKKIQFSLLEEAKKIFTPYSFVIIYMILYITFFLKNYDLLHKGFFKRLYFKL